MTPIFEKALIMRISNSTSKLGDLIDTVVKTEDATPAILDSLDKRILAELEASYVSWSWVIPYLRKFFRNELFRSMNEMHPASVYELAELFIAGYSDDEVEHKLCDSLYGVFRDNANPLRGYILDALKVQGSIRSLEILEVIKYEIDPEVKTKRIVAKSILDEGSVEENSDGFDKTLYMLEFQSLFDFSQRVNSAIDLMLSRGVRHGEKPSESTEAVAIIKAEVAHQQPKDNHKRLSRVEHYLSKARSLLPEHPPEALNNMRKAAEAICKDILDETFEQRAEGINLKPADAFNSLENMVQELKRRKQIPTDIEKYLASLQSFGNLASHDQDLDPKDISPAMAESILLHLKAVVDWYKSFAPSTN